MKKGLLFIAISFFILGGVFAQAIDRSQYSDTTLFDAELWEGQGQNTETRKFKATVQFSSQSGTRIYFQDLDGDTSKGFDVTKRWTSMQSGQKVTIYFTDKKSYGSSDGRTIDDIDFENNSPSKSTSSVQAASQINHSQYSETTLFDVELWEWQGQNTETKKFKATVQFISQSGTRISFQDLDGDTSKVFDVTKRWPSMQRGQKVTIYFTDKKSYGSSDGRSIDDIQF
jgi:NMD protein affecting ribosome stability and mRNA decay